MSSPNKANGEWFANLLGPDTQTGVNRLVAFLLAFVIVAGLLFYVLIPT